MVKAGTLDKHGRKIEGVTPQTWDKSYVDYSAGGEVRGELITVRPFPPYSLPARTSRGSTFLFRSSFIDSAHRLYLCRPRCFDNGDAG